MIGGNNSILSDISSNNNKLENSFLNNSKNNSKVNSFSISSPLVYSFTLTPLIHNNIANIKMKDLVNNFRSELLVFDLEKRNGIIFNLPDVIQCGMIGVSGLTSNLMDLCKLIDNSISLLRSLVYTKEYKSILNDSRTDLVELNDIIGRVKLYVKNLLKDNK